MLKKRMGPRTVPWRTPWVVVRAGDEWFSMDINVVRPVIKDVNHASVMSVIPISCRSLISMQGLIVSKEADKSSNASKEPCLLSRFECRLLEILASAVSVDFLGMKAD